jgi:hypothetical protein
MSRGFVHTAGCAGVGVWVAVVAGPVGVAVGPTLGVGAAPAGEPCAGTELVVEPHAAIISDVATNAS